MNMRKRKRKDGSTVYDVSVMYHGIRYYQTCASKEAAQRVTLEYKSGRIGSAMTLQTYIECEYMPLAGKRIASTSLDTYEREIRLRIVPTLGDLRLCDITRADVQRMIDSCATESVAKKAHGVLKTILNEAVADERITRNPAAARFAFPDFGKKRDNGLVISSFAQIYVILDAIEKTGNATVQKIAFSGFLLGLRPEERYALDWRDIDTETGTVRITKAYVPTSKGNDLKGTKTQRSTRTIPMHPRFVEWAKKQPHTDSAFMVDYHGERLSPSTAQKRWNKFLREHPTIPPVTIENMRHSFATSFLAAGGRVETLSRILGHTNVTTTYNRYVKPDLTSLRSDMELVANCV